MLIMIQIKTDSAEFEPYPEEQVSRLLRTIAKNIQEDPRALRVPYGRTNIMGANGFTVGHIDTKATEKE